MVIYYLNKKLYREHKEKLKVSLVLSKYKVIFFNEHNQSICTFTQLELNNRVNLFLTAAVRLTLCGSSNRLQLHMFCCKSILQYKHFRQLKHISL